jgi:hypothetical protein
MQKTIKPDQQDCVVCINITDSLSNTIDDDPKDPKDPEPTAPPITDNHIPVTAAASSCWGCCCILLFVGLIPVIINIVAITG